jgi:predicted O-linked N-acetylglucosamine transferase (SPINDLY family)
MPDMPRAKPPAIRESQDTSREKANASTLIACPWGSLKINNDLLKSLRRISERSTKHVRFRLLCTLGLDALHYASTLSDIQNVLGVGNVELFADLPYPNYMEKLEECAFALDAFPFGGNTSIVDCIYLRKPIVSRLGWQFYNRAGPVILRYAGFDELVTDTEDGFIALASELVNNPTNLAKLQNRLSQVDVAAVLQSLTSKDAFVEACKYLIYESPDPNIRTPIVIK